MARLASTDDATDVARLAAASADEDAGLNDVVRADLLSAHPDSATWLVSSGLAHVQRDARVEQSWVLGVSAAPADWPILIDAVTAHVAERGGGAVTWWRAGATADDIEAACALGFAVARRQHELRTRLPLAGGAATRVDHDTNGDLQLRTLQPDDVDGVLAVNNAAFAGHPEQGGWTRELLDARMAQPWFDPTLFVVAAAPPNRVVGFNWLKPHAASATDVARGEIYVIAVDPAAHGRGLGRALAVHGLDLLHSRGFEWASLFVAADNEAALALYGSLGFSAHRTDVALVIEVPAR